ncbi:hypothetical protein M758_12G176400, partial [Ceratodon purpureus]
MVRLPLRDGRRQSARDEKLAQREEAYADRMGARRRLCPCNVCLGQNHSMRFRGVVSQHLRKYGRHPFHRGSTEGFEADESDTEWDADIVEEYGVRRGENRQGTERRLDEGLNMTGLVQHTLHMYDDMVGNAYD